MSTNRLTPKHNTTGNLRICLTLICLVISLGCAGCSYDKYDPAVYPVQFEVLRVFPDKIDSVRPFHVDSLNSNEILTTYFTPRERTTERYFQVENLSGSRVLERYNLEYATDYWFPVPTYYPGDLLQCGADRNYMLYLTVSDSNYVVYIYDLNRSEKIRLFSVSNDPSVPPHLPSAYAAGQFVRSENYDKVYIAIKYWYSVKEWRLKVLEYDFEFVNEVFDISTGASISHIRLFDTNNDGIDEFIAGTSAPESGFGNEHFVDSNCYTLCIAKDGHMQWSINHGPGGGEAHIFTAKHGVYCMRAVISFSAQEYSTIKKLDLQNGSVLWQHHIAAKVKPVFHKDTLSELIVIEKDGAVSRAEIMSDSVKMEKIRSDHDFVNSVISYAVTSNDQRFYLVQEGMQLFLLDEQFSRIGFLDNVQYLNRLVTKDSEEGFVILAKNRDTQSIALQSRTVSWISWWTTRYRRQLVFGFAIPALLVAIWSLFRYVHVKNKAARDAIIFSDQLAEVTRAKYRERVKNDQKWADLVHNDIGHRLIELVRMLSKIQSNDVSEKTKLHFTDAVNEVESLYKMATSLSYDIRPPEAVIPLPSMIETVSNRYSKYIEIKLDIDPDLDVPEPLRVVLFSTISEIFTNILKHANASLVNLTCQFEGDLLDLKVLDNGRGIRGDDIRQVSSLGLVRIREQVASFAGQFRIEAVKQGGTLVEIRFPGVWVENAIAGELEWIPVGFDNNDK